MNGLRLLILLLVAVLTGCATQSDKSAKSDQTAYIVADTSRTIDLTRPPRDVWDRIRRGFAIPNLQSELVDHWTQYYAARPESLYIMSQRASKYLYHIVDELERRGLPTELALLPFVESAFNPTALSRSQASGLWQFVPATGRHYNLEQDWWRDMRRDPIASTNAALDYLNYLYEFQGDWYLALASYNWGEGAVRRALDRNEKNGLPRDYRALPMPEETRNYVPKLQAFKNLIARPERYGLTLPNISNAPYFTTVKKTRDIDVVVAAQLAEMTVEEFRELNPAHNRPVIRVDRESTILLPADKADIFMANLKSFTGKLSSWTIYRSKKGESYAAIARKFGMPLDQLRRVNGIGTKQAVASTPTPLLVATTENLPGDGPGLEQPGLRNAPANMGGIQLASMDATRTVPTRPTSPPARAGKKGASDVQVLRRSPQAVTHTVKRGDTLFALARRYNTTVDALRKLNNLKGNSLNPGRQLRVPGSNIRG
mgnify:CR=1 FL=1|jgi:Soluble lytic murein transglycosylase and related regulatory proteins (some contain LysM/invasin domains)